MRGFVVLLNSIFKLKFLSSYILTMSEEESKETATVNNANESTNTTANDLTTTTTNNLATTNNNVNLTTTTADNLSTTNGKNEIGNGNSDANLNVEGVEEKGGNWLQITALLSGSIAACTAGILFAWTSPSIPILTSNRHPGNITLDQASYLTVIPPIGAIVGSPVFPWVMDRIGRRNTLLLLAIPQIIVWTIIMFAESIYTFYISRFINGFGDACLYTVLPTYVGEIASPEVRGTWGNAMQIGIYVGQLLINAVGGYCSLQLTAYIFVTFPIIYFIIFMCMPESPYYLLMKGKREKALNSLRRLRRKNNVEKELEEIQAALERQKSESSKWVDLFRIKSNRRGLTAGCFVRAAQQFSGIAAFNVYTSYLFQQADGSISNVNSSIIFEFILVVMNIVGSYFLDKLGRRRAMIISCAGCAVVLLIEAIYFFLKDHFIIDVTYIRWFPLVGLLCYVIIYSVGLGIVPTLILSELFSASVKGKAMCCVNIIFCIYVSAGTKIFQLLTENYGLYTPFLFFSISCFISTFLSCKVVPETQGRTLEEIQQDMKTKKKKIKK